MLKKFIRKFFSVWGYELKRKAKPPDYLRNQKMMAGLQRCRRAGLDFNTIVDVGAAAGTWSMAASEVWTTSAFLLFEPLIERKQELEILCGRRNGFQFVNAAAGKMSAEVNFIVTDDLDGSGVASAESRGANTRIVQVTRLDTEVQTRNLQGPYLVKLDTHGFELPILEGCSAILDQTELFIIECYGFQIADNSLLFWEMCEHMEGLGYRLFDIVDVMNRPVDGAFWQCDAFFLKKSNPIFREGGYK